MTIRRFLTSSLLSSFLLMTACSGTGDAFHGGWEETYSGGTGGPTVEEITSLANSDDVEAIVNLITMSNAAASAGGSGSAPEPSSVSIPGSDILQSLPPGTYKLKITMTVDGDVTTFESTADANGSFDFEIPPVPTDSEVSIRMDVRDDTGTLALTGRTGKTVSGDSDSLEVTLLSFFTIPLTPPAAAEGWVWLTSDDNYIWELYSSDEEFRQHVSKEGSTVYVGGLAVIDNVIYEIPTSTITVGTDEDLALTLNTAKKFDPNSSYITAEYRSFGGSTPTRDKAVCHRKSDANVPALFDDALLLNSPDRDIFSVVPTGFYYTSADPPPDSLSAWGVHWGEIDTDNWTAILNAVVASDSWWLAMTYSISMNGIDYGTNTVKNQADSAP